MAGLSDTISAYFIDQLKAIPALSEVSIIRNGDESEERGAYICIVDCQDGGNHLGIPGRFLVDATLAIALFTHVTDDASGEKTEDFREAIEGYLYSFQLPAEPVGEWYIRYLEPSGSGITLDGNYRKISWQSKMILQNINA